MEKWRLPPNRRPVFRLFPVGIPFLVEERFSDLKMHLSEDRSILFHGFQELSTRAARGDTGSATGERGERGGASGGRVRAREKTRARGLEA